MSEFKFACPVCGQHITADAGNYGARIECPTCFQKIIVPQAPASNGSKLILTAAQPHTRPVPQAGELPGAVHPTSLVRKLAATAVAALVLVCLVVAFVAFGGKLRKWSANDPHWTLNLDQVAIPETHAAGRLSGKDFICERATLWGGMLSLRQGNRWPPDFGLTLQLFARQSEELAGRTIAITPDRPNPPRVLLRWKDDQQNPMTQTINQGYALRLEFGQVADGKMPAKIYLCLPDEAKSYVAGTFEAEIRRMPSARPPPQIRR